MIFNNGYPSVITGEYMYFRSVQEQGFKSAHLHMLQELKYWLEEYLPEQSTFNRAMEAFRIHKSFLRLVMRSFTQGSAIKEMDRMFIEVFGTSGRAIVEGDIPKTRFLTENTLGNWGLPAKLTHHSKISVINAIRSN